jgi:C-terminal processing protease CtpA/Prc
MRPRGQVNTKVHNPKNRLNYLRQSDGFGLTVTGKHPVKVATVRPKGAAHVAGVREGDRILKVNGMLVTGDNFQEVIKMISGNH